MDQPVKVANPVRDQLNKQGKRIFPCPRSHVRIGSTTRDKDGQTTPSLFTFADFKRKVGRLSYYLKKNLNAPRPSEHPPVRGKKCQNVFIIVLLIIIYDNTGNKRSSRFNQE